MRLTTVLSRVRSPWLSLLCAPALLVFTATPAGAQSSDDVVEEVIVTGTRQTIQDSINLKRNSVAIVDGLNADEIGDIPALSIAEALETITGAGTHRENGGGTEITIRGLGPYLTSTVINGREATNGGGNRAVNFSMFPSELFNGIEIHKTQAASYIEGAVGGQVHLNTRRPIEYGRQRIQVNMKGGYNPDEQDIVGGQELGLRATASYIDVFETDNMGTFGLAVGVQKSETTNPEMEATTGTGGGRLEGCQLDSFNPDALPVDTSGRCENMVNTNVPNIIANDPNISGVNDIPWAYLARDRRYRRNTTGDDREALFAAFQWQPNDRWDVMFDVQASERNQTELRQDVQFGLTQENISVLRSDPRTGVPEFLTAETDIRANTTNFQRLEEYQGLGLNVAYQVNDRLEVTGDLSWSDTRRTETDIEINLGATDTGAVENREDFLVSIDLNAAGTDGVALATINGLDDGTPTPLFDITDPTFFTGRDRAQLRARQQIRDMTITALRTDFTLDMEDFGFISSIQGGVRFSSLEYDTFGGNRSRNGINEFDDQDFDGVAGGSPNAVTDAIVFAAANNCGQPSFPEPGFLSDATNNQPLFTNTNGLGNGSNFATFDFFCLADTMLTNYGGLSALQYENGRETGSVDITEDTLAFYLQANFETSFGDIPARGNFGVRVVETTVDSFGYRSPLTVTEGIDPNDNTTEFFITAAPSGTPFERVKASNSYTEVLPSFTLILDLTDNVILRTGAFRGISRPDPNAYGNGRAVNESTSGDPGDGYDSLEEAVQGITANGNPFLEPLPSWNIDAAIEWYPNQDTMIALGGYWKMFQGGFENVYQQENFLIDGIVVPGSVRTTQVSDIDSELYGMEVTLAHSFDYLPGFLGGFGAKISYNYAETNFLFEDGFGGDGTVFDAQGNPSPVIGILPPARLFGLSRHTSSSQLYWQNDRFDAQAIWKTRSRYFQQFTRDTQGRIRYTDDNHVLELRLGYQLNDNIKLTAEGLNLLNEPRRDYRGVIGNTLQVLSYGPRFFFGAKARF